MMTGKIIKAILALGLLTLAAGAAIVIAIPPKTAPKEDGLQAVKATALPYAELSLSYSPDRVKEWGESFSIKISRDDSGDTQNDIGRLLETLTAGGDSGKDTADGETVRNLAKNPYRKDFSGPILLFLAKFYINGSDTAKASECLEDVRISRDDVWSPLAGALLGKFAAENANDNDKIKTKEYFSQILLEYPQSPEITYADEMLQKIR